MKAKIEGVGTYRTVLVIGYCFDLEKFLYVPEYSRNLVLISRLDILGLELKIGYNCFLCIVVQTFVVPIYYQIHYIISILILVFPIPCIILNVMLL